MRKQTVLVLMVFILILAACAPATQTPEVNTPEQMSAEQSADDMSDSEMLQEGSSAQTGEADESMIETFDDDMMSEEKDEMPGGDSGEMMPENDMAESPAWFGSVLTDARTGETFSIQDFQGKVVLVETLAQWCTNCLRQQKQVLELHRQLGERDDFVSLGLDIDPNEDAVTLKSYIERNGFSWLYAVSPIEVSRDISQLYGDQFLNPPSTPMLIIDRGGEVHLLPFGIKSAAELQTALEPFLQEDM